MISSCKSISPLTGLRGTANGAAARRSGENPFTKPRRKSLPQCSRVAVQPSIPLRTHTHSMRASGLKMTAPHRASPSKPPSRFEPLSTVRTLESPRTCLAEDSVSRARRCMQWGLWWRLPSSTRREGQTFSFPRALLGHGACRNSEPRCTELLTGAVSRTRPSKRVESQRSRVSLCPPEAGTQEVLDGFVVLTYPAATEQVHEPFRLPRGLPWRMPPGG